jgi:hypothetical protein
MPNVYVDAVLFACPDTTANPSDLDQYLVQLIELDELRRSGLGLLLSARTPELLATTQSYPFWDRLPGLAFPQRGDLLRIIDAFFNKSTTVEMFFRIGDLLLDDPRCTTSSHLKDRQGILVEHHLYLLAFMCVDQELSKKPECEPIMLTRGLDAQSTVLHTTGTVVTFEWLDGESKIDEPFHYNKHVNACRNASSLLAVLDPLDLWTHEKQFQIALKITVERLAGRTPGPNCLTESSLFALGAQFERSLQESGIAQTAARMRALLRACAETVLGSNLGATHALRGGQGPNDPPVIRSRDRARGMRRDIDYEFHLHYWITDDGPEFSRVVTHNDFMIAE